MITNQSSLFHGTALVVDYNLTPDLGELYECDIEGTSAMDADEYRGGVFAVPATLDAAFERLARACGLTYGQAFKLLLGWIAQHRSLFQK